MLQAHRLLAKFREIVIEDVPLEEKVSSCGGSEQSETSFLRTIHEVRAFVVTARPLPCFVIFNRFLKLIFLNSPTQFG